MSEIDPQWAAVVKPGEVLALGFSRRISDREFEAITEHMQPFKDRGIEVVIIDCVNRMVVTQPVDNPVDNLVDNVSDQGVRPVDNRGAFGV